MESRCNDFAKLFDSSSGDLNDAATVAADAVMQKRPTWQLTRTKYSTDHTAGGNNSSGSMISVGGMSSVGTFKLSSLSDEALLEASTMAQEAEAARPRLTKGMGVYTDSLSSLAAVAATMEGGFPPLSSGSLGDFETFGKPALKRSMAKSALQLHMVDEVRNQQILPPPRPPSQQQTLGRLGLGLGEEGAGSSGGGGSSRPNLGPTRIDSSFSNLRNERANWSFGSGIDNLFASVGNAGVDMLGNGTDQLSVAALSQQMSNNNIGR
jgi:hypothetical protein